MNALPGAILGRIKFRRQRVKLPGVDLAVSKMPTEDGADQPIPSAGYDPVDESVEPRISFHSGLFLKRPAPPTAPAISLGISRLRALRLDGLGRFVFDGSKDDLRGDFPDPVL